MPTQPLPGVPVDVMLAQPLPGIRVVCHRHLRRQVHRQLPGRPGSGVSKVLLGVDVQVVGAPGGCPQTLLPFPRELRVRWAAEGCTGSSRSLEKRCGTFARSVVVG